MEQNRPLGWTTLEEAKKLVEAGLDTNTADMCFAKAHLADVDMFAIDTAPYSETIEAKDYDDIWEISPCWSLGALKKFIPDEIKVNDVWFYFYCSYNWIRKWCASYVDENFSRLVRFNMFSSQIEMFNQIVLFLLENNHIKKHE